MPVFQWNVYLLTDSAFPLKLRNLFLMNVYKDPENRDFFCQRCNEVTDHYLGGTFDDSTHSRSLRLHSICAFWSEP